MSILAEGNESLKSRLADAVERGYEAHTIQITMQGESQVEKSTHRKKMLKKGSQKDIKNAKRDVKIQEKMDMMDKIINVWREVRYLIFLDFVFRFFLKGKLIRKFN
jgi:hypothetical protein